MQTSFISAEIVGKVVVAKVQREKITEHECQALVHDVTTAAAPYGHRLALDLSGVQLIASAGLGALINLNKECKAKGGKLALFAMAPELFQVFKLTRLNSLLTIVDSKEAAVKALG